jgi:hypothetical protein
LLLPISFLILFSPFVSIWFYSSSHFYSGSVSICFLVATYIIFNPIQPIRVNELPVSSLPFEYGTASEMHHSARGPQSMYYMGQRYDIGDHVAVRGREHPEYFGIITGFECNPNGQKYFWMAWIVPTNGDFDFCERVRDMAITAQDFNKGIL